MRWNMHKRFWNGFANALSIAMATVFMAGCSDDVAGGASGDAGVYAIKNLDVAGLTQKGPFVKGSAVTVLGINCKSMKLSDEHFEGEVKSEKGDFTVDDVSLKSSCAVLEATGKYRSEITGKMSSGEITLHALTDLKNRKNVNVNVITELEYERVMYLVTEKKMNFADAKKQAEKEVLAAFGIAGNFDSSEDLNIFGKGDGNAALLAVSVLMQAETDAVGIEKRLEKFADSFAETGKWNDSSAKAAIEKWRVAAMADGTLDSIRKNVKSWGYADEVPDFEKYIETFGDSVTLGSEYDATANTLKDLRDGQIYRTVKIGDQVWMAENLNFETASSSCYNDSAEYCEKYGRLYTWATAVGKSEDECGVGKGCNLPSGNIRGVCPDGWYLPSEDDFVALIKAVGGEKGAGSKLKSTDGWNDDDGESGNGTDAFGFSALAAGFGHPGYYGVGYTTGFWGSTECGSEGVPETGNGCAYAMYLDYDDVNVSLRSYAAKDFGYSVRCVKRDDGTVPASSSSSAKADAGSEYDASANTLKDLRDGQTYRTVKIGNQVWMAENLNYEVENSICYENSADSCAKYGRLYTWAAAMDSIKTGCGYGVACSPTLSAQGVCPSGWHLPSNTEWSALIMEAGGPIVAGVHLKARTDWYRTGRGTDAFGFTALPAGLWNNDGGFYNSVYETLFWSSTEVDSIKVYTLNLDYSEKGAGIAFAGKDYDARSVRCLKNNDSVVSSSSSSVASSSSVKIALACKSRYQDDCKYDTLTDERDGQTYKTVKIGNQVWMAENLNYASLQPTDSLDSTSFCYENDPDNCEEDGRLYLWSAVMDSAATWSDNGKGCGYGVVCSPTFPVRGVCPAGWHVPTRDEVIELLDAVGGVDVAGDMLISEYSGCIDEVDLYGFSFRPTGRKRSSGYYDDDGEYGYMWTITDDYWNSDEFFLKNNEPFELVAAFSMSKAGGNLGIHGGYKNMGFPVRCIKD